MISTLMTTFGSFFPICKSQVISIRAVKVSSRVTCFFFVEAKIRSTVSVTVIDNGSKITGLS